VRLVIDTNILVSALFSSNSLPAHLIVLWREGRFDLLTSADQLDELMRVTRLRLGDVNGRFCFERACRALPQPC
jgi:predicted nucleic acid-binding protein